MNLRKKFAFSHPKYGPEPLKYRKNKPEMTSADLQGRIFSLKCVHIEWNEGGVSNLALKHPAI